jgi:hypothetical protein
LKLNFAGLTINISRSTLLQLVSFAGNIKLPKSEPQMKPIKSNKNLSKFKQMSNKKLKKEDISINLIENSSDSVQIEKKKQPTFIVKVEANIGEKKKKFLLFKFKIFFLVF